MKRIILAIILIAMTACGKHNETNQGANAKINIINGFIMLDDNFCDAHIDSISIVLEFCNPPKQATYIGGSIVHDIYIINHGNVMTIYMSDGYDNVNPMNVTGDLTFNLK